MRFESKMQAAMALLRGAIMASTPQELTRGPQLSGLPHYLGSSLAILHTDLPELV